MSGPLTASHYYEIGSAYLLQAAFTALAAIAVSAIAGIGLDVFDDMYPDAPVGLQIAVRVLAGLTYGTVALAALVQLALGLWALLKALRGRKLAGDRAMTKP